MKKRELKERLKQAGVVINEIERALVVEITANTKDVATIKEQGDKISDYEKKSGELFRQNTELLDINDERVCLIKEQGNKIKELEEERVYLRRVEKPVHLKERNKWVSTNKPEYFTPREERIPGCPGAVKGSDNVSLCVSLAIMSMAVSLIALLKVASL